MMNVAAALAGDASAMQELEKLKAQRESPAEEAARLAEEMAFARDPAAAPKVVGLASTAAPRSTRPDR